MNVREVVQYWLTSSVDDLKVCECLFDNRNYSYALFFGHLYLEKLLKALVVRQTDCHAPYSHNLLSLAEKAGLSLTKEQKTGLDRITGYNIEARYPEEQFEFKRLCTETFCRAEMDRIEELGGWIRQKIKP